MAISFMSMAANQFQSECFLNIDEQDARFDTVRCFTFVSQITTNDLNDLKQFLFGSHIP